MSDDKKTILLLLAALIAGCLISCWYIGKLGRENKRLGSNQQALLKECDTLRTANGKSMARVLELELTASEFEEHCTELEQQVHELGIKNKRLEHLVQAGSRTELRIDTITKDSIVYLQAEGRQDTLKCWEFDDGWVQASGCINKAGRLQAEFTSNDTLLVVAHRVPKRFLFFRFGCKYIELDVASRNPHTRLTAAKYIKFVKK